MECHLGKQKKNQNIHYMKKKITKSVLFITGAFVSTSCWDEWIAYFQQNGFKTSAPAWPNKNETADVLRQKQPDAAIASERLHNLTEHYAAAAQSMDEKPILIGHSMGGLITQLLLQLGLGCAGIAIHSLQPKGIFTFKLSFYKAGWNALGFFTDANKSYLMSFPEWQYAFTNNMSYEQQKKGYYKLLTPESKLVVRDATTDAAKIDFGKPHPPLLFLAGSIDNFIPASLNHANYKKYSDPDSITEYQLLEGRNHFILGQPTWKEDADNIINWLQNIEAIIQN